MLQASYFHLHHSVAEGYRETITESEVEKEERVDEGWLEGKERGGREKK